MEHKLPPLPYEKDALAPHMSMETVDYRNARPAFVKTFLDKLVNWSFAETNLA